MRLWTIYILECADGTYYTGCTNDLHGRIAAHTAGRGAKYTKGRGPFRLVAADCVGDRASAQRIESGVKKARKDRKPATLCNLADEWRRGCHERIQKAQSSADPG